MKTIATIATTLLFSLGLFVAPANAEDVAPPPCEETAQEWRDRALAAEAYLEQSRAVAGGLDDLLIAEKANVTQANETIYRLVRKVERRRLLIAELRAELRELR